MNDEPSFLDIALSVGRIENDVKHMRDNGDRVNASNATFQVSVRNEFDNVHSRITKTENRVTKLETSLGTSFRWLTALMSVIVAAVTVGVNVIMKLI